MTSVVKAKIVAFAAGVVFSAGLCLSGMTRPSKVLAFLDVRGHWDPSLALVMIGAVGVSAIAFRASARRATPLLEARFRVPDPRRAVAPKLLIGAALFGAGWGLSGLCPGPAVTSLASGQAGAIVFVAAMIAGMFVHRAYERTTSADEGAPLS